MPARWHNEYTVGVESNHMVGKYKFQEYLSAIIPQSMEHPSIFRSPGEEADMLFNAAYML